MENSIVPPIGNTGVRVYNNDYQYGYFIPESKISYSIDWLRITTGKFEYGDDQEIKITSIPLINDLLKVLKSNYNYFDLKIEPYGKDRFRSRMVVSPGIIIYFYGFTPNKKGEIITMIDIEGGGCDRFKTLTDWYNLIKFLIEQLNCNCTRIDAAVDDYYGEQISQNEFFDIVANEYFSRTGTPKNEVDWHLNSRKTNDKGCTVTFYSKQSQLNLVSYNKMAEQISKHNPIPKTPQWLRHEIRFKDKEANFQIRKFYDCLCFELNGEVIEGSMGYSNYINSALYTCLKLYQPSKDSNKSRWKEHPGWLNFIGDIANVQFKRPKTKNDNILKTKVYFEDSYSRFLLKMYLVFGKEYFNLWIKDFLYLNRKKLEPEDFVDINDLRNELGLDILKINEIVVKAAEMQLLNEDDLRIINQYDLPNKNDFIKRELGQVLPDNKKRLVDLGDEIDDEKQKIIKKIEKLQALLGELDE